MIAQLSSFEASRFLERTTFGVKQEDISKLQELGVEDWLSNQFSIPASYHDERGEFQRSHRKNGKWWPTVRVSAWFDLALWGEDQLRQRMAFTLSQILVVSQKDANLADEPKALAKYYDLLVEHAFGNYADLLYEVSRSPVMGTFLTHLDNRSFDSTGVLPDQNYARELMQLFTTGDFALDQYGAVIKDQQGRPVENYDEEQVAELARVFTGWELRNNSLLEPMVNNENHHDRKEKTLHGVTLAANQDADLELKRVIQILVEHPSTAPFIAKFLINRFVSSNPTRDYISRVAAVFRQTNGHLGETLKALLSDEEVFKPQNTGNVKYKEPILRLTYFLRALNAYPGISNRENQSSEPMFYASTSKFLSYRDGFNQTPLGAPSVFNFYDPEFSPEGPLFDNQLVGPELELMEWVDIAEINNVLHLAMTNYNDTVKHGNGYRQDEKTYITLSPYYEAATEQGVGAMLDLVATALLNGKMSSVLHDNLMSLYQSRLLESDNKTAVNDVILMTLLSTDFSIQG